MFAARPPKNACPAGNDWIDKHVFGKIPAAVCFGITRLQRIERTGAFVSESWTLRGRALLQ